MRNVLHHEKRRSEQGTSQNRGTGGGDTAASRPHRAVTRTASAVEATSWTRTHEVFVEDGMIYVRLSMAAPNLPPCIAARLAGGVA